MNDQQQSRADALTEIAQFLTDVVTAAGLLSYGHADKKLATRITDQAYELRKRMYFLTASPVEQPAAAPASANETGAEGGSERFIVIGHGESDIPEAKIVARRADVLDAVLSMIYGGPCPDDAMRAEYASMLGDWDGDHWNVTFEIGGIDVWRASLSRSPAMAAAAPADEHSTIECQAHSGPDCIECNGTGAWSGSADERAVSFEAWCDRFPEISAVERLRDAWQEARAAASPAAEAVTITDAEAEMLVGIKKFHTHDFGRGPELHADAITDAYKRGRAAAPQPAQASPAAERVTAALQALSADVHTLGDGWANDEAMIGLAKKYLRVEPKPASPELSLWRDFVLLAVTDAAPQPAQADAPVRIEALRKGLFNARDALRTIYEHGVTRNTPIWQWIEDANCVLNGEQADAPAEASAKSISDEMMDLADRLGSEWKDVDSRAWQHLLVYAPAEAFPYQKTFNAIAAATSVEGGHVSISVKAFRDAFGGAVAEAREPIETEQSIAADCYHWIAERIGTKDGYSVQEHVDAMCQVIDECADFFHDFVGADEGGNDEAVRIAKNIRALKAGTLQDVSAPADAGEAVAHMRVRSTDAGSTSHAIDIAPEAAALDLKPGEYLLYLAPPTTRAAYLTTTLSPDQRISMAAKLFCFANELLNGADQS
ncbi:hypothetical protein [Burkholderia pseudomallei]|uniref:hypothetical protein n=1 Tax=Burkholderia pseudomallei TaxID=28450 RepID=UPI000F25E94A|nr:hypothetical protein [Burkholderia pseudomallei]CAJ4546652.1 gp43 [Burkholderia pseudomallei]VBU79720.1 gp43 [Burkholderia pseudomallei]